MSLSYSQPSHGSLGSSREIPWPRGPSRVCPISHVSLPHQPSGHGEALHFLERVLLAPATGPLHVLFSLPGLLFPWLSPIFPSPFKSHFQEALPTRSEPSLYLLIAPYVPSLFLSPFVITLIQYLSFDRACPGDLMSPVPTWLLHSIAVEVASLCPFQI